MNPPWCAEVSLRRAATAWFPRGVVGSVIAGVLALTGCAPSPAEVRREARQSQDLVTTQYRDVLGPLTEVGTFAFSNGAWSGCRDFGGAARYQVTGRIDPDPEDVGPLVDRVIDRLAATGVRVRRIHPQDKDPVIFADVRNGVTFEFYGYALEPYVLFDIFGPCIEMDDLARGFIDAGPTSLEPGGE